MLTLTKEFVRFFFNLFSVSLFLKSLFSPIFSIPVNDVRSDEISEMIAVFIAGLFIRLLGAFLRMGFIVVGLFLCISSIVFFTGVFFIWLSMPLFFVAILYVMAGGIIPLL